MKLIFLQNGPILLRLKDSGENATVALCRCGLSETKPFCDGCHKGQFNADDKRATIIDDRLVFDE